MAPRYASKTDVSPDRSRAEIERVLMRYGADGFGYGWEGTRASIGFRAFGRTVRMMLELPDRAEFELTDTGKDRKPEAALKAWEQACKQRWRALALVVKAKLEAVECGITTFEEEFLAHLVLPTGRTVAEQIGGQIDQLGTGRVRLLPGGAE